MRRFFDNKQSFGEAEAVRLRETFQDRPAEWKDTFEWGWPKTMREVGVGMAVMYRSDKWKKKGKYESYKHVCEGKKPWRLFAAPGFVIDGVRLVGEARTPKQTEFPDTIAILALFLGMQCRLFERDTSGIFLPEGDDGIYEVSIPKGKLAAGRTRSGDLFLTVYVEDEGPKLFLFGEELDVEKDGIVG